MMRTIVEENRVSMLVDDTLPSWPRLREVLDGWYWRLSRDPGIGFEFEPGLFLIKTLEFSFEGVPFLTILYEFDEQEVRILSIRAIESN